MDTRQVAIRKIEVNKVTETRETIILDRDDLERELKDLQWQKDDFNARMDLKIEEINQYLVEFDKLGIATKEVTSERI